MWTTNALDNPSMQTPTNAITVPPKQNNNGKYTVLLSTGFFSNKCIFKFFFVSIKNIPEIRNNVPQLNIKITHILLHNKSIKERIPVSSVKTLKLFVAFSTSISGVLLTLTVMSLVKRVFRKY